MTQYQSFPSAAGDSRSLDKLKHLRLPDVSGKRFLDVGCNEGFFCGYAAWAGAARTVGLDKSALFIERARARYPHCEFRLAGWDALPDGPFDVILLASALHYADDQPALVHDLVARLARDGVLVLEIGVASSTKSEWVRTQRGIDERDFPSMAKVREMLDGYAWKWMGPSISQDGDPVGRHVFHVSRPRPIAYLLMQPPGYGKTTIARSLFRHGATPVVSGDALLADIATGTEAVPEALRNLLADDFSHLRLDQAARRAFDGGLVDDLMKACLRRAGTGDFALDMYVPQERHAEVEQWLVDAGYLPVRLDWHRPGLPLPSQERLERDAEDYYLSLVGDAAPAREPGEAVPWRPDGCGYLDEVSYDDGRLTLRGWALDRDGAPPKRILVEIDGKVREVEHFERQIRQDVQQALRLSHALLGYRIVLEVPGLTRRAIVRSLSLRIPDGARFGTGAPLDRMLAGDR